MDHSALLLDGLNFIPAGLDLELPKETSTFVPSYYINRLTDKQVEQLVASNDTLYGMPAADISIDVCKAYEEEEAAAAPPTATDQEKPNYPCYKCRETFDTHITYKNHIKGHVVARKFLCAQCSIGFNVATNLKIHMVREHPNILCDVCPICNTRFKRKASLKSHVLLHQINESYICDQCLAEFDQEEHLMKHIESHTLKTKLKTDPLICQYCKLKFETVEEQKLHVKRHVDVEQRVLKGRKVRRKKLIRSKTNQGTKCRYCDKSFPKVCLLQRHERIHTGEKPFKCQICGKGFAQKGTLTIHVDRHQGRKPYECSLCEAKFTQKGNLRVHIEKTHTAKSGETFKCSHCSCIFRKIASLNAHVTKIHSVQTSDTVKLSEAHASGVLRRYSVVQKKIGDTRWYLCSFCTTKFKKPSDLIRHYRTHTLEKPFKCEECGQSFSLKSTLVSHGRTHSEKSAEGKCEECGTHFRIYRDLIAHMRTHEAQTNPKAMCVKCQLIFSNFEEAEAHASLHPTDEQVVEPILKQPLYQTAYGTLKLKPPKRRGTEESNLNKPHLCPICNAKFTRVGSLRRHQLRHHSGLRKYQCSSCDKSFPRKYQLDEHNNKFHNNNTTIKCHQCDVCDKKFVTSTLLRRHKFIHSETAPYICPYCRNHFKTSATCRSHIADTHLPNEPEAVSPPIDQQVLVETLATNEMPLVYLDLNQSDILADNSIIFDPKLDQTDQLNFCSFDIVDPTVGNIIPNEAQFLCINCHRMFSDRFAFQCHQCNAVIDDGNFKLHLVQQPTTADVTEQPDLLKSTATSTTTLDLDGMKKFTYKKPLLGDIVKLEQEKLCPVCDFQTTTEESFKNHILGHPELTDRACRFCGKCFKKPSDMKRHVRTHTGEKPYECDVCHKKFSLKSTLDSHLRTHQMNSAEKISCSVCSTIFVSKSSLKVHMLLHTGERPHKCRFCPETFRTAAIRKTHEHNKHSKPPPPPPPQHEQQQAPPVISLDFTPLTGMEWTTLDESGGLILQQIQNAADLILTKDMSSSAAKRSECDICHKTYATKDVLRKHKRVMHGQNRKFPCIKCDKGYDQLEELNRHIAKCHSGQRPYSCPYCANSFSEEKSLKTHIKRIHETTSVTQETTSALLGLELDLPTDFLT